MFPLNAMAVVLFQQAGDRPEVHRATIFLLVIAVALVGQAVGVLIAAAFAMKMFRKVEGMTNSFDQKTTPLINRATILIEEMTPRIRAISANVEQISYTVREKTDELSETLTELNRTVNDLNVKTRTQVAHVNGIVSDALDATEEVSKVVQENIKKPVRQIAGIIAGLKAGIETLAARSPFGRSKGYENPYDL